LLFECVPPGCLRNAERAPGEKPSRRGAAKLPRRAGTPRPEQMLLGFVQV